MKPETIVPGAMASGKFARRDGLGGLLAFGRRQRVAARDARRGARDRLVMRRIAV